MAGSKPLGRYGKAAGLFLCITGGFAVSAPVSLRAALI